MRVIDDGAINEGGGGEGVRRRRWWWNARSSANMYVGGGAIIDGDGKPVVIDASGSNDKRVRMVSFLL